MPSHLPAQFDKYTQVVKVSEELFGDLYRAIDSTVDRPVALKVPHPELLRDPAFVDQFRQEARAAAQLDHPNIVHIYSIGDFEETPFLEMEGVEGQSLAKLMADKGTFRPLEALPIVNAVCAALQEAHSKGITHGTLTPDDILLRASHNRIWVSDFGLAKVIDASLQAELGSRKKRLAALRYRSPEQINRQVDDPEASKDGTPEADAPEADALRADAPRVGAQADLFSLGVILYEMLTREFPFVGSSVEEIVWAHTNRVPAAPSQVNANLSPAIDAVVLKALATHPQERFSSAQEMAEAFRTAISQEAALTPSDSTQPFTLPLPQQPDPEPSPAPKAAPKSKSKPSQPASIPVVAERRGWAPIDTGVVALFALAAVATWIFWNSRGEPLLPEPQRSEPTRLSYSVVETPTPYPSPSPAATPFAFASPGEQPTPDRTLANLMVAGIVSNTPLQHLGFDDDPAHWSYVTEAYDQDVEGDELVFTVHDSSYATWQTLPVNSTNYYAEVDVTMEEPVEVAAGIVFNYQDDDDFYLFLTDPMGYYSVWRQVEGDWQKVIDWAQTGFLQTGAGAHNLLGIQMNGNAVRLVINRNVIDEIDTQGTPASDMALYAESYSATDAVTRFGDFRWWDFSMPTSSDVASITSRLPTGVFDFSAEPDQWASADDVSSQEVIDGQLEVTLHEADQQSWQTLELNATDYYFESDATIYSTSDQISAGLLFDVIDDNFYSFIIDVDGNYAIQQSIGGEFTYIQDWIYSPLLQPGRESVNRLGVMAHQDKFWVFVNGELLNTVDAVPSTEGVGLVAGTYDEPEGRVSFDNVKWWDLTGVLLP